MKLQHIIIGFLIGISMISCQKEKVSVTNAEEYNKYLKGQNNEIAAAAEKALQFWNPRIQEDSIQITALSPVASAYSQLFQTTGDIAYLKKAEQVLTKTAAVATVGKSAHLLALATNYISQHRFKDAKKVAEQAYLLKTNSKAVEMVLFDISMELGEYKNAQKYLEGIADQSDFNFLIRLAKWNDYKGNLDVTIKNMEKAKKIAERSKKPSVLVWSYTNLADYYGHAGRIRDSYNHYLMALEIDPSNAYAKKGIAWIIYSYENNPKEALRILDFKKYRNAVKDERYGKMYNTYNALVLAEEYQEFDQALAIASEEIKERPTPQSYDLKAYILNLKGDHNEALSIAENYIVDKTFEPLASFHIAQIYKANNLSEKASPIIEKLIESSYELGPLISQEIKNL